MTYFLDKVLYKCLSSSIKENTKFTPQNIRLIYQQTYIVTLILAKIEDYCEGYTPKEYNEVINKVIYQLSTFNNMHVDSNDNKDIIESILYAMSLLHFQDVNFDTLKCLSETILVLRDSMIENQRLMLSALYYLKSKNITIKSYKTSDLLSFFKNFAYYLSYNKDVDFPHMINNIIGNITEQHFSDINMDNLCIFCDMHSKIHIAMNSKPPIAYINHEEYMKFSIRIISVIANTEIISKIPINDDGHAIKCLVHVVSNYVFISGN